MSDAATFRRDTLTPGAAWCLALPGWTPPFDARANVLLTVIAGQESGWTARVQGGPVPAAHGFFQFERMGGVNGVLTHPASKDLAAEACRTMFVAPDAAHAWAVMATEHGDNLAVAFARLLLWTDPASLPAVGDEDAAWDYYVGLWRPGKPSRERWSVVYPQAVAATLA